MRLSRRSLIAAATLLPAAAFGQSAEPDPRLTERSLGRPDARPVVIEFFSLTCGHCAAFHRDIFPRVKSQLIDTGRIRMVLRDFPLDQLALGAAAVARSLPPAQYDAFVSTLLSTQDRWAFNRNADPAVEIGRLAAIAGMSREQVAAALADRDLQRAILEARQRAEQEFRVSSTPTFVFGSKVVPGSMTFDRFAEYVREAAA